MAGPYRGRLRECYHSPCDVHVAGSEADVRFLAKTTEATAWTLADLADGRCGPRGRLTVPQMFILVEKLIISASADRSADTVPQNNGNKLTSALQDRPLSNSLQSRVPNINSIASALEMLHFLGVVPSLQEMTTAEEADTLTNAINMAKSLNNDFNKGKLITTSPSHKSTRSTIDLFTEESGTAEPNG